MSGKDFAQINSGILRSRKLRVLTHGEKWAYLCTHLTSNGKFCGVFCYPLDTWASEAQLGSVEMSAALEKLVQVGLVEFDEGEELVRIIDYHHQRPPQNASFCGSLFADLKSYLYGAEGEAGLVARAISELAVAALTRAREMKPDGGEVLKMRDQIKDALSYAHQDAGEELVAALSKELLRAPRAVRADAASLFAPLAMALQATVTPPSAHRANTRDLDLDETRLRADEDTDGDETQTAVFRESFDTDKVHHEATSDVLRKSDFPKPSGPTQATPSAKRSQLAQDALRASGVVK